MNDYGGVEKTGEEAKKKIERCLDKNHCPLLLLFSP